MVLGFGRFLPGKLKLYSVGTACIVCVSLSDPEHVAGFKIDTYCLHAYCLHAVFLNFD